jgi:protoporphyrinogen oxidase
VVLGAGPSGLGAGLALARAGARVVLLEAADRVGGLCVTRRGDGVAYDLGGHIPFVRSEARREWLADLLDGDLIWVDRPVSCVLDGDIVRGRYLDQRPAGAAPEIGPADGALAYLTERFDAGFADEVVRPYIEKIDGVPLENVPAERLRKLLEDQAAPTGFWFPRHGIGQLMDAMADAFVAAGGELRLRARATSLRASGGRVRAVDVDGPDGSGTIATDDVVVSVPAGLAAQIAAPPPPGDVMEPVRMRAVALVYLMVERAGVTSEPWIQVSDPRVPFARVFEMGNWSGDLTPGGRAVLGMECYCQADDDDPVWGLDDAELAAACHDALVDPLGWLSPTVPVSPIEVVRLPRAYPVPDLAQLPAIMAPARWLSGIEGVHLAPGSAVIEAIAAGERAAAQAA